MEKISSSETLRDVINGMTVQGTAYQDTQNSGNNHIENGQVNNADGQWMASWWLGGDGSLNINYSAQATDHVAILEAVEAFIAEVME